MKVLNIEIKAKCSNPTNIRNILNELKADYKGLDHQVDTYFNCDTGRLKLRSGNIENSLIYYNRSNQKGPKASDVSYTRLSKDNDLKGTLERAYGVKVEVDKNREIYFIENIKFHIDQVEKLGSFVEIEAIDTTGEIGIEELQKQCEEYIQKFDIKESDLIDVSYSDMLL